MKNSYDVAAYVWPSYTGDEKRTRQFWPQGFGEWESVLQMQPKFPGHLWPRRPLWGYVNEADPGIMEMQINTALKYGVNVFIYDWYWYDRRPFLENCLNGFLRAPSNEKMKFCLMWANHNGGFLWDYRNSHIDNIFSDENAMWLGAQDRKEFEIIVKRITEKYFTRPNYYKIDGKPVFSVFEADTLVKGLGGVKETRNALDWFRRETEKAGFPGLHLQIVLREKPEFAYGQCSDLVRELAFDSATHYQMVQYASTGKDTVDYSDSVAQLPGVFEKFGKCAVPYFPHVSAGWDNNVRYKKFVPPLYVNNTPQNFEKALRTAKEYLDKNPGLPPLVTINSWNEWTEGSYLEPDDLNGYGYLEAIDRVFRH